MVCIYCGSKTSIVNSRPGAKTGQTWRRHCCDSCHATFSTTESYQLDNSLLVESTNGKTEPFLRDKLFLSIYQAAKHLDNSCDKATHLTQTVISNLLKTKPLNPLISTKDIYQITCQTLKRYDATAAIRYASTVQSMPTINDVKRFLRG